MVISAAGKGSVYSFKPGSQDDDMTVLEAVPATPRPGMTPVLPVNYWRNENDFREAVSVKKPYQFVSPDRKPPFLPAGKDFVTGQLYYGSKFNDLLRSFRHGGRSCGAQPYLPVSDESEQKEAYVGDVGGDGAISNLRLFAEQGGEYVTVDEKGNVYIAAGQVFVYDPSGHLIDTIEIPERPSQLLFGGSDGHTLFILARSSLYVVQARFRGR